MARLIEDGVRGMPGSWQDIIENALDSCISPVALALLDGSLAYVNHAFLHLWDLPETGGLAAKPLADLWEDREKCLQALEAVRDGHSWVGELAARRADGSVLHAHASLSMVTDSGGAPLCVMGSFVDITDRKKAEERLSEALDLNQKTLASSLLGIITYRADTGQCIFANEAAGKAVGCTAEQLEQQDFRTIPSWKESGLLAAAEAVLSSGRETRQLAHFTTTFGQEVWLDYVLVVFESGGEKHLLLTFDDVTERHKADQARRRAEEALRESEHKLRFSEGRLRGILSSMADLVFVLDRDGRFTGGFHSGGDPLLFVPPSEFVGKAWQEVMPPELHPALRDAFAAVREGRPGNVEYHLRIGEEVRWFSANISSLYAGAELAGSVVVARDITKRKRAEEECRANERFLQSIFDCMQDGLSVLDTDLNILRVNSWMERLYASNGPLVGKKCYQAYHLGESPCQRCPSLRAMSSGKTEVEVVPGPLGGGRPIWLSLSSHPWKDESGRIIGVIEHVKDITEAKEAEERQVAQARRWQTTFDSIGDAVALLDMDGRILQSNATMAEMVGMPTQDLRGCSCWEVWFGSPVPVPGCPFERMRRSRRRESEVFSLQGRWFDLVVDPVLDGGGHLLGAVHIASEITGRVKAEAALVQAQKLASVGQLAAGVAHEINNPLAALSGEIQLLAKKTKSKAVSRSLRFMDKVSRRIGSIVTQLLTFSREAPSKARERLGINGVVESSLALIERRLDQGGVRVVRRLAKGLPELVLSRGQMEQVILNVLSNSFDAMPGGGSITVTTRQASPGVVEIVLEDTGSGIPKADLPKVFDPFFTTKPPGKGVGLGLSVNHGIVLSHGGRIEVFSEPGQGVRVTIALPVPARK